MRHSNLCCVLTVVLIAGASGCAALSGLGAKQEISAQQTLLPELPAPALATLEKLVSGGEIWKLTQKQIGGKTFYDIRARVAGTDVRYEIASDGLVVSTGGSTMCTAPLQGIQASGRKDSGSASALGPPRALEGEGARNEVGDGLRDHSEADDTGQVIKTEQS
jgi:hypothetical protein